MLYTTLNKIRSYDPCPDGWTKLLKSLDKTRPDDEPLSFKQILDSNWLDDALWCLRAVDGYDNEIKLFAVWCARQAEHLDPTGQAKMTNDIAERYANGLATIDELIAARAAARAACDAACDAARAAARAAASDAACDAAGDAAWYAAWAAAWDAARDAARDAASAAASAAAWDAAWDAARDAAREKQAEKFMEMFCED